MANLVDGRMLNSLTKEDLKKLLKIGKKSEQLSLLTGVELLRMHEYNREVRREGFSVWSKPSTDVDVRDTC